MTATERRSSLMSWLCERPAHSGLTAAEIVDVSGIYDWARGGYQKCRSDLMHWYRLGLVARDPDGHLVRWVI